MKYNVVGEISNPEMHRCRVPWVFRRKKWAGRIVECPTCHKRWVFKEIESWHETYWGWERFE